MSFNRYHILLILLISYAAYHYYNEQKYDSPVVIEGPPIVFTNEDATFKLYENTHKKTFLSLAEMVTYQLDWNDDSRLEVVTVRGDSVVWCHHSWGESGIHIIDVDAAYGDATRHRVKKLVIVVKSSWFSLDRITKYVS